MLCETHAILQDTIGSGPSLLPHKLIASDWVVSQGREQHEAVLADPASIPHSVEGKEREILSGVAPQLYEERYGELMDVY